jgi:Zn-dependent protease with chaperone function
MKLLRVVVEGQLYLAGVLAIFLAELAFLAWGLLSRRPIIGLLAVFVAVPLMRSTLNAIRAIFFRIGPPEGLPLDRSTGAALYALVEEVAQSVGAPRIHSIAITSEFNAGAATHLPPWRLRRHRTVVLGLPVLATLSTAELRAVIAHELAHFSGAHDPFSAWVHRTLRSWSALSQSLHERLATPLYVYWLIRWYVPRLKEASADVVRRHELVADRVAGNVAGGRATADALVVLEGGARFASDTYWPAIRRSYETQDDPPRPYSGMLAWDARLRSTDALNTVLFAESTGEDTHPTIRERLAHLDQDIRLPDVITRSAGEEILGSALELFAGRLDEEWLSRNREVWHDWRTELVGERTTLARLAAIESPTPEELFKRAELVESLEDAEEALPIYERAAGRGHVAAQLAAGRLLLDRRDPRGIALVEDAMERDEDLVPPACRLLSDYYTGSGQDLAARRWERRAARYAARIHLASR